MIAMAGLCWGDVGWQAEEQLRGLWCSSAQQVGGSDPGCWWPLLPCPAPHVRSVAASLLPGHEPVPLCNDVKVVGCP